MSPSVPVMFFLAQENPRLGVAFPLSRVLTSGTIPESFYFTTLTFLKGTHLRLVCLPHGEIQVMYFF